MMDWVQSLPLLPAVGFLYLVILLRAGGTYALGRGARKAADRGVAGGVQVAASYLGTVLGGGVCVLVYDRWGWVPANLLLALLTATALGVVIGFREPTREVQVRRPESSTIVTS